MIGLDSLVIGGVLVGVMLASFTPDDFHYASRQKDYFETMNIPDAWQLMQDFNVSCDIVKVGVVETDIKLNHPDLINRIYVNTTDPVNNIDDDMNGCVDDYYGADFSANTGCVGITSVSKRGANASNHGTFVAGLLAAETNNRIGIAGVAGTANVRIVPILSGGMSLNKMISMLKYFSASKIPISNHSYGEDWDSTDHRIGVIDDIIEKSNHLLFAAGANAYGATLILSSMSVPVAPELLPPQHADYPCSFKNSICIGATLASNPSQPGSHFGSHYLDIAAIGEFVDSLTIDNDYDTTPGRGASYATPIATAAASLMLCADKNLTRYQVTEILCNTVTPGVDMQNKVRCGGYLNVGHAISTILFKEVGEVVPKSVIAEVSQRSSGTSGLMVEIPLIHKNHNVRISTGSKTPPIGQENTLVEKFRRNRSVGSFAVREW